MPGGLLQLVSYGSQNIYLNGNPSISFFKKIYKTHTNFATESIRVNFNKTHMNYNESTHLIANIKRNGDLLNHVYLAFTLPEVKKKKGGTFNFVENIGEAIIEEYYINIGGNTIDKQYGEWLHIWSELSVESSKRYGYEKMIGNIPEVYRCGDYHSRDAVDTIISRERKIIVPLRFWFNLMPGLALPLIALQYHEIDIHVILRPMNHLFTEKVQGGSKERVSSRSYFGSQIPIDPYLECNYVFLDTDERTFFAKNSHDYLIEQVTRHEFFNLNRHNVLDLKLQNPVKELYWVIGRNYRYNKNQWFEYGDETIARGTDVLMSAKLSFNGLDRMEEKDGSYYGLIQPYQHHTVIPKDGVYVYAFSLYPEKFQPSGACNMSRINKVQMHMTVQPTATYAYDAIVYASSYNFLRITSGLAGVAFSC